LREKTSVTRIQLFFLYHFFLYSQTVCRCGAVRYVNRKKNSDNRIGMVFLLLSYGEDHVFLFQNGL